MNTKCHQSSTFASIFFRGNEAVQIQVPDYQRAFSWEEKQINLFISDLKECLARDKSYYFGHFIVEESANGTLWEVVDGQQRLTTFVLFLMMCEMLSPEGPQTSAYSLPKRFLTVSYDREALKAMASTITTALVGATLDAKKPPSDDEIIRRFELPKSFTHSQRRMALALLRFHQAFDKRDLDCSRIPEYIEIVMAAQCSCHKTTDKSVAVSIFELHNTRGVPLSTIDIVKAKLMKFVFDHGGDERDKNVANIQSEFGGIYAMEEQLSVSAFRGKLSIEQLLRLHLRVVDDGAKMANLDSPAVNANGEALISHIESRLHFIDGDTTKPRDGASGVSYALALAKEFRESMRIVSQELPCWDRDEPLVGDVMIFEPQLSCQFFLLVCRRLKRVSLSTLKLWERLLFTRDFHDRYYRMTYRDDFPSLFALCGSDQEAFANVIKRYVQDGFRPHLTKDLQRIVRESLEKYKETILTDAFDWWKKKMTYAIYKYEASKSAQIRDVMKGRPSVEHILPRAWEELRQGDAVLREMSDHEWNAFRDRINACIDGLGNLLLISGSENSSLGNSHPADKPYERSGGSYQEHDQNSETWRLSSNWESLIRERGEKIFSFMIHHLVGEV